MDLAFEPPRSQPVTPGFWSPGLQNYETIHLCNDLSLTVCEYTAGVTVEGLNFNVGTAMGAGRCSQLDRCDG